VQEWVRVDHIPRIGILCESLPVLCDDVQMLCDVVPVLCNALRGTYTSHKAHTPPSESLLAKSVMNLDTNYGYVRCGAQCQERCRQLGLEKSARGRRKVSTIPAV
jgi:hypothetical protein